MRSLAEIESSIAAGQAIEYAERTAYQVFRWLETQSFWPMYLEKSAGNQAEREKVFTSLQTHGIATPQWLALPIFQHLIVDAIEARLAEHRRSVKLAMQVIHTLVGPGTDPAAIQHAKKRWQDELDALDTLDDAISVDAFNLSTMRKGIDSRLLTLDN